VKSLMEEVPDLPNFSRFHDGYRDDPDSITFEGDMRGAFFAAYEENDCEYLPLMSPKIDERLKSGREMVSANFVIPYPPGLPIMVPGQVIAGRHDRVHAQARRQGNPRLQQHAGPQADQAVGDSSSAIRREKHAGAWPTPRRLMRTADTSRTRKRGFPHEAGSIPAAECGEDSHASGAVEGPYRR
jgi:hypothetical protein